MTTYGQHMTNTYINYGESTVGHRGATEKSFSQTVFEKARKFGHVINPKFSFVVVPTNYMQKFVHTNLMWYFLGHSENLDCLCMSYFNKEFSSLLIYIHIIHHTGIRT